MYWEKLKNKKKIKNLKVIYGCSINEALSHIDLHVTSEGCTTTFESCFKKIPTIEICEKNSNYIKNEFYKQNIKLNTNKVYKYDDLIFYIEKFKKRKNLLPPKKNISKYKEFNYYKIDGNRALIYANQIDRYISNISFNNNFITKIKFIFSIILNIKTIKYSLFSIKTVIKLIIFKKYTYQILDLKQKKI